MNKFLPSSLPSGRTRMSPLLMQGLYGGSIAHLWLDADSWWQPMVLKQYLKPHLLHKEISGLTTRPPFSYSIGLYRIGLTINTVLCDAWACTALSVNIHGDAEKTLSHHWWNILQLVGERGTQMEFSAFSGYRYVEAALSYGSCVRYIPSTSTVWVHCVNSVNIQTVLVYDLSREWDTG